MSDRIVLTLRTRPAGAVDASSLALHDWTDRPGAEIAKLSVRVTGAGSVALGDLFSIAGERAPRIRLTGDFSAFEGLGAELAGGDITIEGDVGPRVGTRMRAGQIRVTPIKKRCTTTWSIFLNGDDCLPRRVSDADGCAIAMVL